MNGNDYQQNDVNESTNKTNDEQKEKRWELCIN